MFCMHCGAELPDDAIFCSSCGKSLDPSQPAGAQPTATDGADAADRFWETAKKAGASAKKAAEEAADRFGDVGDKMGDKFGEAVDKLNEMAGGTGHIKLKFGDLFKGIFKHHEPGESGEIFTCGTKTTTPSLQNVSTAWPRPWVWTRVLLVLAIAFAGCVSIWTLFQGINAVPGIILLGSFMMPVAVMTFFFETNAPRNISFFKVLEIFFIGGVLALVAVFVLTLVIRNSGTGALIPSMLTGLIEELAKIIAIVFFMSRVKGRNYILNGLLIGAAVGAGFAAFESAGYAFTALLETNATSSMMYSIILRAVLACGGHVAWAAVEGAILASCEGDHGFEFGQLGNPKFLGFSLGMVVLHGLWDANVPLLDSIAFFGVTPKYVLLIVLVWIVLLVMLHRGLAQVNELAEEEAAYSVIE